MTNGPANDVDETAEEKRDAEIERLSEVLWNIARSTNTETWDNQKEPMNLGSSEQSVGKWLRGVRNKFGSDFALEVQRLAAMFGDTEIESLEAQLLEAKRAQIVLDRPASDLARSLIQVAKLDA